MQQEVLSGWKEIARYLDLGVRTVQRYERELHLPIRRLSGNRRSAVIAAKSDLDSWVKLSATSQELALRKTQIIQEYLSSEMVKGLRERAQLQAQMTALRTELKASVREVRESILKVREQMKETRRRQDSIASVIKGYANARAFLPLDGKHRKPS